MNTWEGGMRAPAVVRWPGVIRPGTVKNDIFASLDWVPTLVNIAGGDKGDALNQRIMAGSYPGIVKTKLDGVDQTEYLSGRSEKSARDTFFYYSGKHPSAVRYKNWKIYFAMVSDNRDGLPLAGVAALFTGRQVVNIKRDPFETSMGSQNKTTSGFGGAIGSAGHGLHLRLEHAADRPGAVAEGTGDPTRSFRRFRIRRATTSIRSWSRSRRPKLPVAATDLRMKRSGGRSRLGARQSHACSLPDNQNSHF